jgi:cytochrome P450
VVRPAEHVVTMNPPLHIRACGFLSRLFTPLRLCENEDFVWRLSGQPLFQFVANGKSEFIDDLLGVPAKYPAEFRAVFGGMIGGLSDEETLAHNPLVYRDDKFSADITDRRQEPREDVLTELAQAECSDGSTPEVDDAVRLATFLFAAGQETTTKMLGMAMRVFDEGRITLRPPLAQPNPSASFDCWETRHTPVTRLAHGFIR